MRRRNSLAALPIHRHSLPQIALDAGLVALAYFIAYRLRFDGDVPEDYQQLFERTLPCVITGSVVIIAAFGLYRHGMRYSAQTRNPFCHSLCGPMDSGFSLGEPRNDGGGFFPHRVDTSGAVEEKAP